MSNYERLVERISKASKLDAAEIERRVEAKRAKLSGLVSKEGAAQIVAAELGISFENEKLKVAELVQGMKRANVVGKITRIFPVREFNKNGREGKVANLLMGDETANTRVVLWDVNHISLVEKGELKEGDVIEISNGSVRNGEVHLSGFSDIKKSKEILGEVKFERSFAFGKLKDAREGVSMKLRAVIVQSFEPRYFESKQREGEKGVILNMVLDDGSENIRGVLFTESLKGLGIKEDELFDLEKFNAKRIGLLGEEKFFFGSFRINAYFNNLEMNIDRVEEIDADNLIKELEAKV